MLTDADKVKIKKLLKFIKIIKIWIIVFFDILRKNIY